MRRALAVLAALATGVPAGLPQDADLDAGIRLVREGDFESALPWLEAAARRLEGGARPSKDLARAYLYLGISHLELKQEVTARARFRAAALEDPTLSLDAKEFSPQVLRFFEAAHQEATEPATAPAPLPSRASAEEEVRADRGSKLPVLIIGSGVAAAGIALAAGGGGATTTLATTSTSSSTSTTSPSATTTSTSTTTTPPAACRYQARPARIDIDDGGGSGACSFEASRSECPWTAEAAESWIRFTNRTSGTGDGRAEFEVLPNPGGQRSARVWLKQDPGEFCELVQAGQGLGEAGALTWSAQLDLPGGEGQVRVAGSVFPQPRGLARAAVAAPGGELRVEGVVVAAEGGPGTWRFELAGPVVPGSLRVLAGEPLLIGPMAVAFRLEGVPGERVAFAAQTRAANLQREQP
jgi:hypothetical protein